MKEENNKEERIAMFAFSFAFLSILLTIFVFSLFTYQEIRTIDMKIHVGGYVGFNLDARYLEFGTAMPGGYSERHMYIHNTQNRALLVEIDIAQKRDLDFILGKAKPIEESWITISENNFVLKEGGIRSVKFTIEPPIGTPYGNYSSKAVIKFRYI